ncbi:MAG: TPM domain-containing protein [Pseudomonadota bacterium]
MAVAVAVAGMRGGEARRGGARHLLLAVAALLLLAVGAVGARAQPKFPALTGRIVDTANLLPADVRARLATELAELEGKSTDQLVVVTVPSLQGYAIEDYGYQLGRAWGIGQKGKDNGVILLVAPGERKVRIEVGRGLEPTLTDIMSKLIVENAILPAFRRGDFAGGISAGVRDIKDVLLGDAEAVKERARGAGKGPGLDREALIMILIWLAIVGLVVYAQMRHARQQPNVRRGRRAGSGHDRVIIIPGGSGSWGGGWSGGGGGGWSGGGGSFGGGGASGGW